MLLLGGNASHAADDEWIRYRGEYTYGHEVEIFCPAINSQCYWLSPDTEFALRQELRAIATEVEAAPYTPVCVVVEGQIDRESARSGFAADYDGLVTLIGVFGKCDETAIVTQGDLQHHRWLLESINGVRPAEAEPMPELDFGERMHVSGSLGCNRYTARAALRGPYLVFSDVDHEARRCTGPSLEMERVMLETLGSEPSVTIDERRYLNLVANGIELQFRLEDWK
jgi:heat shock protein HslJ